MARKSIPISRAQRSKQTELNSLCKRQQEKYLNDIFPITGDPDNPHILKLQNLRMHFMPDIEDVLNSTSKPFQVPLT